MKHQKINIIVAETPVQVGYGLILVLVSSLLSTHLSAASSGLKGRSAPPDHIQVQDIADASTDSPGNGRAPMETPYGWEISAEHHENFSRQFPQSSAQGGRRISVDSTPGSTTGGIGFAGPTPNGLVPYDAAIAVGPNHVLVMANSQWVAYSKTGTRLFTPKTLSSLWGTAAGTPFDPRCYHDDSGHYVMMATSQGNGLANMYVAVSQTDDPTGSWWKYTFDWRLDGTVATSNWGDLPGLGYDDQYIYISANQYTSTSNAYRYAKVRVLSKAELFSGAAATYTDFIQLLNDDGGKAFAIKPARCITTSSSGYLFNTRPSGGTSVSVWRVDHDAETHSLTRLGTLEVGSFIAPPKAAQLGTSTLVASGDSRTQDTVWQLGFLHSAFSESYNSRASVRYLRISTAAARVMDDITYTSPSSHLYYPAVTPDAGGNVLLVFNRSSSSEYISLCVAGKLATDPDIGASTVVKAGSAKMTQSRWGDYNAVANDGPNLIWGFGGYAGGSSWNSWVTSATFDAPATTVPAAPQGLSVAGGDRLATLSWTPVAGAVAYDVYRSVDGNVFSLINENWPDSTFADATVSNGTTYSYNVRAKNGFGASDPSARGDVVPNVISPSALAAVVDTAGPVAVVLSWQQSTSPGVVTNTIYRADSAEGPWSVLATLTASTSYRDEAVVSGATYVYRVTASTDGGESLPTDPVAVAVP